MIHKKIRQKFTPIAVVLGCALLGGLTVYITRAATVTVPVEAELGTLAGAAGKISEAGASGSSAAGGNAVRFGTSATATGGAWSSGVESSNQSAFATWRGRPLDNVGTWPGRDDFTMISNPDVYGNITGELGPYKQVSIGLAMLPEKQTATFAACARGDYDQYYRTYGTNLVRLNRNSKDTFIRLGWEGNGDWFAWSIKKDYANWTACFRREAMAVKQTAPNIQIDWNMNKESVIDGHSVVEFYPGDDVVDIIGVDFYSSWPSYPNKAAWDGDYNRQQNGGPIGIGSWLAFAKLHGKKMSVPEWGLNNGAGGGSDDAYFIQAMYDFFHTNAANIAYETYFNLDDPKFLIYPAGINPQSSTKYQQLWSKSPRP